MNVTVLTPTYNRAYVIEKLYKSLLTQTAKNFEWLVVDDGSADNTKELINGYINEKKIKIRYIFQENGGKHRALNKGISCINNEVTFIVDSDDYLLDNAIENITKYYEKYKTNNKICGFSFLRCFPDMRINGMKFKEDEYISDYISCRLNEKVVGDKAEAYITKYLKKTPFLEVENEKFLFEDYVWMKLAMKYDTVHINVPIYVGDYLSDGLTKNITKTKVKSPKGMMERAKVMCNPKCNIINRIKGMILYSTYGKIANINNKKLFMDIDNKFLYIITKPFAWIMLKKIKKESE